MKTIIVLFFIAFAGQSFGEDNFPVGKFDIDSAQCDGENFLWKKHDQIIISKKVIAFEGVHSEDENELCRFQDVYRLNQDIKEIYTSSQKNLLCWQMLGGEKSSKATVKVESTPIRSLNIKAKSKARGAELSLEGTELCSGKLTMDLSFHINQ